MPIPVSQNSDESAAFRRVLIEALKQNSSTFDLARLKEDYCVPNEIADKAVRAIFMSQCMGANATFLAWQNAVWA